MDCDTNEIPFTSQPAVLVRTLQRNGVNGKVSSEVLTHALTEVGKSQDRVTQRAGEPLVWFLPKASRSRTQQEPAFPF